MFLSRFEQFHGAGHGSQIYQYDGDGNLERHTRPDGSLIDYEYNARNLLAMLDSNMRRG